MLHASEQGAGTERGGDAPETCSQRINTHICKSGDRQKKRWPQADNGEDVAERMLLKKESKTKARQSKAKQGRSEGEEKCKVEADGKTEEPRLAAES